MSIHVVNKKDNAVAATFAYNSPLPPLGLSSVRVKTELVAITSNNLSYARNGSVLYWWDLYPVPSDAPSPYNNPEEWGIVPAWGYGIVSESNISSIKVGTMFYGFWPTSSYPIDLKLEIWKVPGYWDDKSEHRAKNMTVYNRYIEISNPPSDHDRALVAGVQAVWQCAYLLNLVTFPSDRKIKPIHPLGLGHEWTAEEADLRQAVVVSLSAASKTARSFAWNFSTSRDLNVNGPLALLQATSSTKNLINLEGSKLNTRNVAYTDLSNVETINWMKELSPKRFVVFDFGAASEVLLSLNEKLKSTFPKAMITNIAIGSESKVFSAEDTQLAMKAREETKKIQVNTSTLRDRAIEASDDPADYFNGMEEAWERCLKERGMGEIEVLWRKGVEGAGGIEGMWKDVCNGKVRGDQCLVAKVQE